MAPTFSRCVCLAAGGWPWPSSMTWLDAFCYGTAVVVPVLPIPATVRSWFTRELGLGGRRPEPILAALLCNSAWLVYGRFQNSEEAFCLNLYGGVFQMVYLGTFLALCPRGERMGALMRVMATAGFLVLTVPMAMKIIQVELHKLLCAGYGVVAAAMPLRTIIRHGNRNLEVLPHWIVSSISLVHGVAWFGRGLQISNYYMAAQNASGVICSAVLLGLPFFWAQPTAEETGDYTRLPGGVVDIEDGPGTMTIDTTNSVVGDSSTVASHNIPRTSSIIGHGEGTSALASQQGHNTILEQSDVKTDEDFNESHTNINSEGKVPGIKEIDKNSVEEDSSNVASHIIPRTSIVSGRGKGTSALASQQSHMTVLGQSDVKTDEDEDEFDIYDTKEIEKNSVEEDSSDTTNHNIPGTSTVAGEGTSIVASEQGHDTVLEQTNTKTDDDDVFEEGSGSKTLHSKSITEAKVSDPKAIDESSVAEDSDNKPGDDNTSASEKSSQEATSPAAAPGTAKAKD